MALTLIATAGATDANAFTDLATAQDVIDATPNAATAWGTDPAKQTQALVQATSLLSALAYKGVKATVGQALPWPRGAVLDPDYGDSDGAIAGYMSGGQWGVYLALDAIPRRVIRACTMLALEILRAGTSDVWGVDKTANIKSKTIDVLTTEYVDIGQRRFGLRVYPSVWREVYPLTLASAGSSVERA